MTQNAATEPPFRNAFWDNHEAGLYVDVATGEPLFSSTDKFDSGTGWPSFTRRSRPGASSRSTDSSHGMERTEVRSQAGDSHLGHVFDDGPAPTRPALLHQLGVAALHPGGQAGGRGLRRVRAAVRRQGAGGGRARGARAPNACTRPAPGEAPGCEPTLETAILAGGCFWGMEDILRQIPGVLETEVGYTGGTTAAPDLRGRAHRHDRATPSRCASCSTRRSCRTPTCSRSGSSGCTTRPRANRQGNDVGTQYRSAIFVTSPEQRKVAEAVKATRRQVRASGRAPSSPQIVDAGPFTLAEDYHQKYLEKNPGGYTCHYLRN